jgi:hypothetical protein
MENFFVEGCGKGLACVGKDGERSVCPQIRPFDILSKGCSSQKLEILLWMAVEKGGHHSGTRQAW